MDFAAERTDFLAAPFPAHDRRRVVANIRRGLTAARTTHHDASRYHITFSPE